MSGGGGAMPPGYNPFAVGAMAGSSTAGQHLIWMPAIDGWGFKFEQYNFAAKNIMPQGCALLPTSNNKSLLASLLASILKHCDRSLIDQAGGLEGLAHMAAMSQAQGMNFDGAMLSALTSQNIALQSANMVHHDEGMSL